MPIALRRLLAVFFIAFAGAAWAADIKPYVREDIASDVVRLTEDAAQGDGEDRRQDQGHSQRDNCCKDAAAAIAAANFKDASALLGAAVAAHPKDAAGWLAFAKLGAGGGRREGGRSLRYRHARHDRRLRRLSNSQGRRRHRPRRSPRSAISRRATNPGASALDAYKREPRSQGRCGHPRHSTRTCARSTASASSTTRSTTSPPIPACASTSPIRWRARPISRPTSRSPARRTRRSPTRTSRLCVEGLRHGERYAIVVRQGLPSTVGENPAEGRRLRNLCEGPLAAGAFRRPRLCAAAARPARRAADDGQHDQRCRSTSIASATAICLSSEIAHDDFLKPISSLARGRHREPGRRQGLERRDGRRLRAQQGRRHRFPARPRRSANCSPGLYLVTARPWTGAEARRRQTRTTASMSSRRNGWSSPISA